MPTLDLNSTIAAASAFASAVAATAALFQVRRLAQASESAAYLQLIANYAAPEMRQAVSELATHWRTATLLKRTVIEHYQGIHEFNREESSKIRENCRIVSSYFVDCVRLFEAGVISKKILILATAHPGINAFYEVAVPLNHYKNGGHNSIKAEILLKRFIPVHGEGIY